MSRKSKSKKTTAKTTAEVDAAVADTNDTTAEMDAAVTDDKSPKKKKKKKGDALTEKILATMPEGSVTVEKDLITVSGDNAIDTKNRSAKLWRLLGELRSSGEIDSYPKVETKVVPPQS